MNRLMPFGRNNLSVRPPVRGELFGLLDDVFADSFFGGKSTIGDTFKMDVKASEAGYTVEAELPGAKKEEIAIDLEKGTLTLSVNRQEETQEEDKNYLHRERRAYSMRRSIYLNGADDKNVSAKLEDGVLRIEIAKQAKDEGATKIEIE